ncbi:PREDICTED: uncharacterized protein LOC108365849 [Rhagoletis zephyria]|uniref:uncharacterized protein LOC108365849 n=1 Tax=Rhagoletis zephyria TaxID=28612 RepID=UPI0008116EF4|nr:PREDICTED: uncharacterized protein LOC108365849 [Rhagoletis zephyria]
MPLHSIAPKSPLNIESPVSDNGNVGNCIASAKETATTVSFPPMADAAMALGPAKSAMFNNYLPHNCMQAKPNLLTNFTLATGDYVLPDALPKIAPAQEDNEKAQTSLQQQKNNPIVSYGYVTSDFWSQQNTLK